MKKALMYVFLVWITTIVLSPLIYYYVFGAKGLALFAGSEPDRQFALIVLYPFSLLYSLPVAAVCVFLVAIINRELESRLLKKTLIVLSEAVFILIIFFVFFRNDIRMGWELLAIYWCVALAASIIYRLPPE